MTSTSSMWRSRFGRKFNPWDVLQVLESRPLLSLSPIKSISLEAMMDSLGGMICSATILVICQNLSLDDNTWETVYTSNVPPKHRCRHSASLYKNNIVIFGGNDSEKSYNDVHMLKMRLSSL